jgi:hypothetical protein
MKLFLFFFTVVVSVNSGFAQDFQSDSTSQEYVEAVTFFSELFGNDDKWKLVETQQYYQATYAMKQYLILSPDASDSRAAQDKIYEWE